MHLFGWLDGSLISVLCLFFTFLSVIFICSIKSVIFLLNHGRSLPSHITCKLYLVIPLTTLNTLTSRQSKPYKQKKYLFCITAVANLPINIRNKVSLLLLLTMLQKNLSSALKDAIFVSSLKAVPGTGMLYGCTDLGNTWQSGSHIW